MTHEVPAARRAPSLFNTISPLTFSQAQKRKRNQCYLCDADLDTLPEAERQGDHLPPENLFPGAEHKLNLIRVPICGPCHRPTSEDDAVLWLALSGFYNRNTVGEKVWLARVHDAKKRLRASKMIKSILPIGLITPDGLKEAIEMSFDSSAINRVLIRMTKGFLAYWYPDVDRSLLTFQAGSADQFKVNDQAFRGITDLLSTFERGAGVYRCWHGVESYSLAGMWIHMFFGSALFVVEHKSDRQVVLPWQGLQV
jgi:hypothetical protein